MKEIKNKKNTETRKGVYDFDSVFIGLNKNNNFYCAIKQKDETTFLNGYEAINLVNGLLNEFDSVRIEFTSEVSKNGNEYEIATPIDYKI